MIHTFLSGRLQTWKVTSCPACCCCSCFRGKNQSVDLTPCESKQTPTTEKVVYDGVQRSSSIHAFSRPHWTYTQTHTHTDIHTCTATAQCLGFTRTVTYAFLSASHSSVPIVCVLERCGGGGGWGRWGCCVCVCVWLAFSQRARTRRGRSIHRSIDSLLSIQQGGGLAGT